MKSISVYAKPRLGFPGGFVDYFRGSLEECDDWMVAHHYYDCDRYEFEVVNK